MTLTENPREVGLPTWLKALFGFVTALFAIAVGLIIAGGRGDQLDPAAQKRLNEARAFLAKIPDTAPGLLYVDADDLRREYEANELAADAKYKGRRVRISGTVSAVGKDLLGSPYVALTGGGRATDVQAMFDRSDTATLVALQKGQSVVVECRVDGKMVWPIARDCSVR